MALDMRAIALVIVALIIGLAAGYGIAAMIGGGAVTTVTVTPQKRVYSIGFTLPLSGELSSIGKVWEKVVQLAIDDLNRRFRLTASTLSSVP
jgi:branched-chain amino acid transport system substrate-binding protein